MSKEEFIEQRVKPQCAENYVTLEHFHERNIILPCACDDPSCAGWAILCRSFPEEIEKHNRDYAPGGTFAIA